MTVLSDMHSNLDTSLDLGVGRDRSRLRMIRSACRLHRAIGQCRSCRSCKDSGGHTPASARDAMSMYMFVLRAQDIVPRAKTLQATFMANFLPSVSMKTPYSGMTIMSLSLISITAAHQAQKVHTSSIPKTESTPKITPQLCMPKRTSHRRRHGRYRHRLEGDCKIGRPDSEEDGYEMRL